MRDFLSWASKAKYCHADLLFKFAWRYFSPLISLHTGTRVREIADLTVHDFREKAAVPYAMICSDDGAERAVPDTPIQPGQSSRRTPAALDATLRFSCNINGFAFS